jgi:Domain of unknown function (DUF4384)
MFRLPGLLPDRIALPVCAAIGTCLIGLSLTLSQTQAQSRVQAPEAYDLAHEAWFALKSRCGTCHLPPSGQSTATSLPAMRSPSVLAADRKLIEPGWPDRSELVWRMLDGHDAPQLENGDSRHKTAKKEITKAKTKRPAIPPGVWLVRHWIARLQRRPAAVPKGSAEVLQAVPSGGRGWLRVDAVQTDFKAGDQIVYRVRTDRYCRLSLINVDPRGIATVVFPNAYAHTDHIDGEAALVVPSADDPFLFTARQRGVEKLVALCADDDGAALGIRHDFTHQRFTVLGDWEQFLTTGRPPRLLARPTARRRWRYRRVRRCYRTKRRGRTIRRCRWHRRRAGLIRSKPLGPLPPARLRAVTVVAVKVR